MQRQPVMSRALRSVGYDAEAEELQIEFHSGSVYAYEGVPRSVYEWLLRIPNKGVFVTRQIVGQYTERVLPSRAGTPSDLLEQALIDSLAKLEDQQ
ncbi:MAG TPA: KTSC domain-containing protein [Polyangiaceae bacterium]|nr:KTSC domain-containing protein [Polyangiaceae bacterium]